MLRDHLARAQCYFKKQSDHLRSERPFAAGEQDLLKLQPYVQSGGQVLCPFPVRERVCTVAYRLQLPPYRRIHPFFHVSQLNPFTSD